MAEGIYSEHEVKKLLAGYREKLQEKNIQVSQMYLYGSYAKKTPHKWSDIDICIISPAFRDGIDATMMLMKLRSDQELLISPTAFSPESFVDENPLAWEIKKTGILMN